MRDEVQATAATQLPPAQVCPLGQGVDVVHCAQTPRSASQTGRGAAHWVFAVHVVGPASAGAGRSAATGMSSATTSAPTGTSPGTARSVGAGVSTRPGASRETSGDVGASVDVGVSTDTSAAEASAGVMLETEAGAQPSATRTGASA